MRGHQRSNGSLKQLWSNLNVSVGTTKEVRATREIYTYEIRTH